MIKDELIERLNAIAAEPKLTHIETLDALARCNAELARFAVLHDDDGELVRAYRAIINSCREADK